MEVVEVPEITYGRADIFTIWPFGDIHLGSRHCDEVGITAAIAEVARDKNARVIGMGDYIDAILKDDKRFDIGGLASWVGKDNIIETQRNKVKALFWPVRKKILCMITGNHEETIHLNKQDDITRNICKDLECRYGGYSNFTILKFRRGQGNEVHQYKIHAWHGAGASQTEGARINRLMRLVNDVEADIYLMGHLHAKTMHSPDRLTYRNGKIKAVPLHAAVTGSWLTAYTQPNKDEQMNPSYAERAGFKPNSLGCPKVKIWPDRGRVWIEM